MIIFYAGLIFYAAIITAVYIIDGLKNRDDKEDNISIEKVKEMEADNQKWNDQRYFL